MSLSKLAPPSSAVNAAGRLRLTCGVVLPPATSAQLLPPALPPTAYVTCDSVE